MVCRKCNTELPDGSVYCLKCGTKQQKPTRTPKRRGNGQGSAYKRGNTWVAQSSQYINGKLLLARKGGFPTKKSALAYLNGSHESADTEITFAKLYARWQPQHEPRICASTMRGHAAAYGWYKPIWMMKFTDICTDDLQKCVNACPAGRRTKENMKSLAMLLYKYAGANKITTANYAQYIWCGDNTKGTRPAFTLEEVEKIRQAIGVIPYAEYIYCMIYTGFRPGELLALPITAYDPKLQTLTGGSKTTAGRNRIVTLSPKIQPIVEKLAAEHTTYIFQSKTGKKLDDKTFRDDYFNPIMKQLGIKDRVPYSCRHTFANLMKNVRGSDTDKAALIGHSDASMTKYYQSPDYESLRNITNNI